MTHDNTFAAMAKFNKMGAAAIHDRAQPIFTLDHNVQGMLDWQCELRIDLACVFHADKSDANLAKYDSIRKFAEEHSVTAFPAGRGIGHQVIMEEGFVLPGSLVVASDSHSNMYATFCVCLLAHASAALA